MEAPVHGPRGSSAKARAHLVRRAEKPCTALTAWKGLEALFRTFTLTIRLSSVYAMASKFRYEYSVREGKNETLLGTITCTLFGSDEPYDDAAGRVPIYQMKHSHDAKSGLTTVSGYAESDLDFFEPQLSWEGSTINSSSHQWPKNDKGESLCVSIYCDGEVKKPVVEYRRWLPAALYSPIDAAMQRYSRVTT